MVEHNKWLQMVKLDKIYTKSGDKGKSSLGNGERLPKFHNRFIAIGEIDEVNACLGLCAAVMKDADGEYSDMVDLMEKLQNDLFDVGADLCMPGEKTVEITKDYVDRLEQTIDHYNAELKPLTSFILQGGNVVASHLHLARTVSRRAERALALLNYHSPINPHLLSYINRLSDLLFVLARYMNKGSDILWEPQKWQKK